MATLQATYKGGLKLARSGAWLKDRQQTPEGERSYSINVGSASSGGVLRNIRIFEFDGSGRMVQRISAGRSARYAPSARRSCCSCCRRVSGGPPAVAQATVPTRSARSDRPTFRPVSLSPAVTFSAIDMAGNGFGFWNTMPMRRRDSVTRVPGA